MTLDICQSTIVNEELSFKIITTDSKRNTDYFTKNVYLKKKTFQISKYTNEQQQHFLTMFHFQQSQINQQEFEQLADLFLKNPMVYDTSKLEVGKYIHHYNVSLNPILFSKNNAQGKFQYTYRPK